MQFFASLTRSRVGIRGDGEDFATNFCGDEWDVSQLLIWVAELGMLHDGLAKGIEVMVVGWLLRFLTGAGDGRDVTVITWHHDSCRWMDDCVCSKGGTVSVVAVGVGKFDEKGKRSCWVTIECGVIVVPVFIPSRVWSDDGCEGPIFEFRKLVSFGDILHGDLLGFGSTLFNSYVFVFVWYKYVVDPLHGGLVRVEEPQAVSQCSLWASDRVLAAVR